MLADIHHLVVTFFGIGIHLQGSHYGREDYVTDNACVFVDANIKPAISQVKNENKRRILKKVRKTFRKTLKVRYRKPFRMLFL